MHSMLVISTLKEQLEQSKEHERQKLALRQQEQESAAAQPLADIEMGHVGAGETRGGRDAPPPASNRLRAAAEEEESEAVDVVVVPSQPELEHTQEEPMSAQIERLLREIEALAEYQDPEHAGPEAEELGASLEPQGADQGPGEPLSAPWIPVPELGAAQGRADSEGLELQEPSTAFEPAEDSAAASVIVSGRPMSWGDPLSPAITLSALANDSFALATPSFETQPRGDKDSDRLDSPPSAFSFAALESTAAPPPTTEPTPVVSTWTPLKLQPQPPPRSAATAEHVHADGLGRASVSSSESGSDSSSNASRTVPAAQPISGTRRSPLRPRVPLLSLAVAPSPLNVKAAVASYAISDSEGESDESESESSCSRS